MSVFPFVNGFVCGGACVVVAAIVTEGFIIRLIQAVIRLQEQMAAKMNEHEAKIDQIASQGGFWFPDETE